MCFSADASLAAGAGLLPVGAYCITLAGRKNAGYLPLAGVPLLFGIQQFCEAGVWWGLETSDPHVVKGTALGFLFFAIAFWPFWIPFATATVEPQRGRRRVFLSFAGVGLVLGCTCYIPLALRYDDWLIVQIAGHSIQYDLSAVPMAETIIGTVWQVGYVGLVCVPLLMSRDLRLKEFGLALAVSAIISHLAFRYAFASVWCFFAALLSLHIGYVLYRLPSAEPVTIPGDVRHIPA